MALYNGVSKNIADLISLFGISKTDVIRIINRYPQHKIGELKFITGFRFEPTEIPGLKLQDGVWRKDPASQDDFTGWVYPDGSSFSCEDFPEAASVYAKSSTDTSFKVPDLTDMFFAGYSTGYDRLDESTLSVGMKNDIPSKHTHSLTNDQSENFELKINNGFVICASRSAGIDGKYAVASTAGNKKQYRVPMLHAGSATYRNRVPFPLNMRAKIGDIAPIFSDKQTENAKSPSGAGFSPNPQFSPSNRLQPVMIYIGPAKKTESRDEFTVIFRDWNNVILSEQTVISGLSAVEPENPSRANYDFTGWDKPFDKISANTDILAVYTPKTYTVKAYSNNDSYGTVEPISGTVQYGQSIDFTANPAFNKIVSCWIEHGLSDSYGIDDTRYTVYPSDINIGAGNQLSVTAVFTDAPEHIGWSLRWNVEYNSDESEKRVHFASNIANYIYRNQLISGDNPEPIDKYAYTVASDTVKYRDIPANNREWITLEKLYGHKTGDNYEVSKSENYGRFLLCTKKKDSSGLSAATENFYGYVFDTGSRLNVGKFVTPVGNIIINGWEDFPGADGVFLSSANFTNTRDPELYPVPLSAISDNPIYLNVRTDGDDIEESYGQEVYPSDVSCATKAQYTAFWGSENPVFITDAQILEN